MFGDTQAEEDHAHTNAPFELGHHPSVAVTHCTGMAAHVATSVRWVRSHVPPQGVGASMLRMVYVYMILQRGHCLCLHASVRQCLRQSVCHNPPIVAHLAFRAPARHTLSAQPRTGIAAPAAPAQCISCLFLHCCSTFYSVNARRAQQDGVHESNQHQRGERV